MKTIFATVIAASMFSTPLFAADIKVKTQSGALIGSSDGTVNTFKGVPYAQPPIGDLRWVAPQPIKLKGVRNATEFASPCLQTTNADGRPNGGGVSGASSEDCLYLNVWAPVNARKAPIMLWIFGGGGTMGAGSLPTYDGTAFARDGVILVTINYRLGALGGFAHPALTKTVNAKEGFANYHLLDAMAALRWMKDNAKAFGGDPKNVTVFGESAGATITANLVTSPMAKGYFDKAIIQSTGSLPTPASPLGRAEEQGVAAMTALGIPGTDADVKKMRALSGEAIIADRAAARGERTILDGRVKTQSILDSFASGAAIDVPMIIGTNSDEGRLRGTQQVATHAQTGAPVWHYFFDYVPDWRRTDQPNGVPHAGEIPYVFETVTVDRTGGSRMTDKDKAVAKRVHSCWVAFAKAEKNARELRCADGFTWPARSEENNRAVAIFQEQPSIGRATELRSPPNGAKPGPTSRD